MGSALAQCIITVGIAYYLLTFCIQRTFPKNATLHFPMLKAFVIQSTDAAVFGVAEKYNKLKPKQESNQHINIPGE